MNAEGKALSKLQDGRAVEGYLKLCGYWLKCGSISTKTDSKWVLIVFEIRANVIYYFFLCAWVQCDLSVRKNDSFIRILYSINTFIYYVIDRSPTQPCKGGRAAAGELYIPLESWPFSSFFIIFLHGSHAYI